MLFSISVIESTTLPITPILSNANYQMQLVIVVDSISFQLPITKLPISVNNHLDIVAKQTDTRLGIRGDHELELRLLASSGVQKRVSDALLCHHRNDGRKLDLDLELTGHWVANVVVGGAAVNVGVALVNLEMCIT